MEDKIAVITIPIPIPMAKALFEKIGYSGEILKMTMDDYVEFVELKDKFASSEVEDDAR